MDGLLFMGYMTNWVYETPVPSGEDLIARISAAAERMRDMSEIFQNLIDSSMLVFTPIPVCRKKKIISFELQNNYQGMTSKCDIISPATFFFSSNYTSLAGG
ncbi:hypothetical protein TNCV_2679081 [Trichonephila clavipes]|nr:hypothetical protein TNCV_2679081 [Trichonephila clavipes]